MNILIADDSATARMFIKQCLEITIEEDVEFLEAHELYIDILNDLSDKLADSLPGIVL